MTAPVEMGMFSPPPCRRQLPRTSAVVQTIEVARFSNRIDLPAGCNSHTSGSQVLVR